MQGFRRWGSVVGAAMAIGVLAPPTAMASGPKAEQVRILDACNKADWDVAFRPGLCQRDAGSVTGADFNAKLNPVDFGHDAWWFNASGGRVGTTKIKAGDSLHVVNEGGENHTFTEVEKYSSATSYTGGCIAGLTRALGLTPFPGDCAKALPETIVAPGASTDRIGLAPGAHHFICVIHPWMRQTVEVERR